MCQENSGDLEQSCPQRLPGRKVKGDKEKHNLSMNYLFLKYFLTNYFIDELFYSLTFSQTKFPASTGLMQGLSCSPQVHRSKEIICTKCMHGYE